MLRHGNPEAIYGGRMWPWQPGKSVPAPTSHTSTSQGWALHTKALAVPHGTNPGRRNNLTTLNLLLPCCKRTSLTGCFCLRLLWQEDHVTSKPFPHHDAHWKGMTQLSNIWRSQSKPLQKVAGRAWEWRLRWMFPNPKYDLIKRTQRFQTIGLLNPLSRRTGLTKRLQFCEDPKYGLFACIWVCTLSERPTMLFAVWPWFLHAFPTVYFPIDFR